ncbi:lipase family alpha/beta hydrolase [Psychromonas sp. GE-S-Ul-11]|uniref:lipase family alpha/beta hydrolase n=1 Tax=Psychromonas sp. GE-S-Ul-11 TaxID=3241170 RepID=UPI00390C87C6
MIAKNVILQLASGTISIKIVLLTLLLVTGCANSEVKYTSYQLDKELVVLAHGLGRSDWAMWRLEQRLEDANYRVCTLDYATIGESIESVLTETSKQIDACLQNANKAHFVGHSLGGLVIRSYLQENKDSLINQNIGEIVLMGTPNTGSEFADYLSDSWLMKIGGEISTALMTGENSLGSNLEEIDVNLGIIAGTKASSLTSEYFIGPNDGLVSVESTKLKSMSDFIEIEVTHTQMRYDLEVAEQTIHFLKQGKFKH